MTLFHLFICPVHLQHHPNCFDNHDENLPCKVDRERQKRPFLSKQQFNSAQEVQQRARAIRITFGTGTKEHFCLIVVLVDLSETFHAAKCLLCIAQHPNITLHCCFEQVSMRGGGSVCCKCSSSWSAFPRDTPRQRGVKLVNSLFQSQFEIEKEGSSFSKFLRRKKLSACFPGVYELFELFWPF